MTCADMPVSHLAWCLNFGPLEQIRRSDTASGPVATKLVHE